MPLKYIINQRPIWQNNPCSRKLIIFGRRSIEEDLTKKKWSAEIKIKIVNPEVIWENNVYLF